MKLDGYIAIKNHLDLLETQRSSIFASLIDVPDERIWQPPAEREWCVGEILDQMQVIYRSFLPVVRLAYFLLLPPAWLRRNQPYATEIDDVYRRPSMPQNVGWLWPPRYTPRRPTSIEILRKNLTKQHMNAAHFFLSRPPDLLGNVKVFDPPIGWLNLIQTLQVAAYHDRLHIEQIESVLQRLDSEPQSNQ
jgi:hypothetical protein